MTRYARWLWTGGAVLCFFLTTLASPGGGAQKAGNLVMIQGEVAVRPSGAVWQAAVLNQDLWAGDMVRTGANSRAAILCLDESQLKLNENTVLVLKNVAPSPRLAPGEVAPAAQLPAAASLYQLLQGEIWLRNKKEDFLFELETPTVTATIRGTEVNVRVLPDGTTKVVLVEGRLKLRNPYGEIWLTAGEEGLTRPGQAPVKRVLVQPQDAVQWMLYYPGYFSYRDLPLRALGDRGPSRKATLELAGLLSQGEEAYDQGHLQEAGEAAQKALALDPDQYRALVLAGWVSLQHHQPEEARTYFQRLKEPGPAAVLGAALARYRLGDALGAYGLVKAAYHLDPAPPVLGAMVGYFAMLVGRVAEARSLLTAAAESPDPLAGLLGKCYLAQMDLVQDRKAEARTWSDRALAMGVASPLARLTRALVDIADFELSLAQRHLEKALETDPRFLDALLYLVRLHLGGDYLNQARRLVERALRQAPREAQVLALAGFVEIAFRHYDRAEVLFARAIKVNPYSGEPHLGVGVCHFRYRRFDLGLREMLTATLLDPRWSLFQSELGKAYYQVRAFEKALATWEYAAGLDPRDPTPQFYKGIALTDLNRPGEAIQAINRSIALNEQRAVFRSRLMLTRDLSVRNYNLARAYEQLGLGEWALSKALTAVKADPLNSSAHLFLASSYAATVQRVVAQDAENLIYRVLAPANQTTFRYLLNNDYTPVFEMPYARGTLQGGVGAWRERNTIQEHSVSAYGGLPGLAFFGMGTYGDDRGFRSRNGYSQSFNTVAALKGEPTVHGTLTGFFQYINRDSGDTANLNDYFYRHDPNFRDNFLFRMWELAYVHRFTPKCALVLYGTFQDNFSHWFYSSLPFPGIDFVNWYYHNLQAQQQVVLGNHTFIGGFDYFSGRYRRRTQLQLFGFIPYLVNFLAPEKSYTLYLMDYWRLSPWLLLELGVFKEESYNARYFDKRGVSANLWSPRLGINLQLHPNHTLRFGLLRYLNTHLLLQPLLVPTEVAGLPWPQYAKQGAEVRLLGADWEAQWNDKTYTVLRFDLTRSTVPEYSLDPAFTRYSTWRTWKRYQASLVLNRILTNSLGLTLGVGGKRVIAPTDLFLHPAYQSYTEVNGLMALNFLTPQGWQGGARTLLVYQQLRGRSADNLFALVNLRIGKELANKRGLVSFEVQNLCNRHFGYLLEPYGPYPDFYPARRLMGKIALYF